MILVVGYIFLLVHAGYLIDKSLLEDPNMKISPNHQALLSLKLLTLLGVMTITTNSLAGAEGSNPTDSSTTTSSSRHKSLNGKATYYPNSLNGHKTSSGETFHQNGHTAASNKLPLGTHVKVTNAETGKSTDVKITDRGPKLGNHKIDLSKKAAREIGLTHRKGKVPVTIDVKGGAPSESPN
jgi:rare lipoprotein A